jgi:hypothetical protein
MGIVTLLLKTVTLLYFAATMHANKTVSTKPTAHMIICGRE